MGRAAAFQQSTWTRPEWTLTVTAGTNASEPVPDLPQTATDVELVSAARAGSREAFDLLVVRHRREVYRICYRYAGHHEDAADLAQDVFLRAFRSLKGFKGDASFKTWLYRIAVNVSLSRVTSTTPRLDRMEPLEAVERADLAGEPRDESLLREERARRIRGAIARLPPKQRATVILRIYQELSHEEIARVLGTSVGACKANLFHALKRLRALLQP